MNRSICRIAATSAALLLGQASYAQDPAANWAGPYLGAAVGYSWSEPDYTEPDWPQYDWNPSVDGFVGGLYAGYNHPVNGLVLGVETDVLFGDQSEGADRNAWFNNDTTFDFDWTAHLRARLGYPVGKTLVYLAGGVAWTRLEVGNTHPNYGTGKTSTLTGWSLGAGVEYAATDRLALRLEYLYDDFGSESHTFTGTGDPFVGRWEPSSSTLRAGIAYCF